MVKYTIFILCKQKFPNFFLFFLSNRKITKSKPCNFRWRRSLSRWPKRLTLSLGTAPQWRKMKNKKFNIPHLYFENKFLFSIKKNNTNWKEWCLYFQTKTIAEQMAEKINAKLGYRPPVEEEKVEEKPAETFKRYEEELEINDFPQTARWKVTSKVRGHLQIFNIDIIIYYHMEFIWNSVKVQY